MRVVHVTEALGGGITTALQGFATAASEYEHALVYAPRERHDTGADLSQYFSSVVRTRAGLIGFAKDAAAAVESLSPDIVHVHATWAGVILRSLYKRSSLATRPLVYSPHSFYFERHGPRHPVGAISRLLEQRLAQTTTSAICVSPYEADLAKSVGLSSAFVPNFVPRLDLAVAPNDCRTGQVRVVTVGRIAPQKDPGFFAEVIAHLRHQKAMSQVDVIWVGDGSQRFKRRLLNVGVEVTGWLPRDDVLRIVSDSTVFLHTAAWEGNPMSLLEARALGVPIVARSIPALNSLGYPPDFVTPADVSEGLKAELSARMSTKQGAAPVDLSAAFEQEFQAQRAAILHAYREAIRIKASDEAPSD